jgi:hypothetical protein
MKNYTRKTTCKSMQEWFHKAKPVKITFYRVRNGENVFFVYASKIAKTGASVGGTWDNKRIGQYKTLRDAVTCADNH